MADELGTSEIGVFDELNDDENRNSNHAFYKYEAEEDEYQDENSKNYYELHHVINHEENGINGETSQEYDLLRRKMFVGGLSSQTTVDTLKNYFSKYGEIEDVNLLKDRETGRSRCFGFLTFRTRESIEKARQEKHTIDNRAITVNFASPETPIKEENLTELEPSNKVYVGHLSKDMTEEQIEKALQVFGIVKSVLIIKNENEESRGYGFVMFDSPESAKAAKDAGECTINGNTIQITRAVVRKGKKINQNPLPLNFQLPGVTKTPISFTSLIPSQRPPFNPINPFSSMSSPALPALQQQILQQQAAIMAARLQGLTRPGLLPSINPAFQSQNTNQQSQQQQQQQQSANPFIAAMAAQYYGFGQFPRNPFVPGSAARPPFNPYAAYTGYAYPATGATMGYGNYPGYPPGFPQPNTSSQDRTGSIGSEKEVHESGQVRHSPSEQPHQDSADLSNQNDEYNEYYAGDYRRSKREYNPNDEQYNCHERSASSNSHSDEHRRRSTSRHRHQHQHQHYRRKSRSTSQGAHRKKNGGKREMHEKERERDRDRNYDKEKDRDTRRKSRRY